MPSHISWGVEMQSKLLIGMSIALLLTGCHISHQYPLSTGGAQVRFVDTQLDSRCRLLGKAQGVQNNWLSGYNYDKSSAMHSATNDLRNKAATMGGNVVYGAADASDRFWFHFFPVASKISGSVYKCP